MNKHLIAPSLLAADFGRLREELEMFNASDADWLHLDVMDGRFVPNITFGMFIIEAINKVVSKPLDVHLMIVEPERYVPEFISAGADVVSVHYEACPHLHRNIQQIRQLGAKAGVALNPHTPVHLLKDLLHEIDLVCLMSVNPGFGGQKFIEQTYQKITELRQMANDLGHNNLMIEIDGGVTTQNAEALLRAGADVLVAGSLVFKASDPPSTIRELKKMNPYTQTV